MYAHRICVCPSLRTRTRNHYTTVVVGKKAERNNININISSTSSNDKPDLSFIFFGTYFKLLPKWLRLFIKFIFLPIIFYIGYSYFLRDILSFYNGIFFIKLFIFLFSLT